MRIPVKWEDARGALEAIFRRTLRSEVIEMDSPATAGVPFIVPHNLGQTPKWVGSLAAASDASVYATDEDRREWGQSSVKVRCPVANTRLLIRVDA